MGSLPLPQEVMENILRRVDGKTLLACEEASPLFAPALARLDTSEIWKERCHNEISKKLLFQLIVKMNPHTDCIYENIDWKKVYKTWCIIDKMKSNFDWQITTLKCANSNAEIRDLYPHGDLLLVLLKYKLSRSIFYKVVTLDNYIHVLHKSWHTGSNTLYVTPIDDGKLVYEDIPLFCNHCRLVGISPYFHGRSRIHPIVRQDRNTITAEHANGDLFTFYEKKGLLGSGNCSGANLSFCPVGETSFIEVLYEDSELYISCGNIFLEYSTAAAYEGNVSCIKASAGFILVGTDCGTMYIYYCKNEEDVLRLDLASYTWRFYMSYYKIKAVDVMILENEIRFICCTENIVYFVACSP